MREDPVPRFVRVPAGEFSMGSTMALKDERPCHRVHVDAFYISIHPVTVDQYAEFAERVGHAVPGVRDLPLLVTPTQESSFRDLAAPYVWRGGEPPRERGRHPVTLVTHADATAYCGWFERPHRHASCACLPKPNGNGRRAASSMGRAIPGATTSIRRARISCRIRR